MKFARFAIIMICLVLCFGAACKKSAESPATDKPADKYASVKETAARFVSLLETCAKEVEAATEGAAIAAALNKMNDGMLIVAPKIKTLGEQFPELNDPANIPADLKPFMDKMDAIQPVMMTAIEKAKTFASEPAVQAALARFSEIQKLMQ